MGGEQAETAGCEAGTQPGAAEPWGWRWEGAKVMIVFGDNLTAQEGANRVGSKNALLGDTKRGESEHRCRLPVPRHKVSLSPQQAVMAAVTSAASVVEMEEPICLVENQAGQGLAVRQDALQALANITQPVVVVAITGLYRSGKSCLMNRLAGWRTGEGRGGMGTADPTCPPSWDSPPLRFTLLTPTPPTQVSPWAPKCRIRLKESGCGACLTPASLDIHTCCWTPKGWETENRARRAEEEVLQLRRRQGQDEENNISHSEAWSSTAHVQMCSEWAAAADGSQLGLLLIPRVGALELGPMCRRAGAAF